MARGGGIRDAGDLGLNEAQPCGAAPPVTILQQHGLRGGSRRDQFALQQLCRGGAKDILPSGMLHGERVDRGGDPRGIETFVSFRPGLCHDAVHHLPRYRTAPTLSRDIPVANSRSMLDSARFEQSCSRYKAERMHIFSLTLPRDLL